MSNILFTRTHFSLGESMANPKVIPHRAKELGYAACAIVDTMSISGMIPFSLAAQGHEIKPICGVRVRIVDDPLHRKPKKGDTHEDKPNPQYFWELYIKNEQGFRDLAKLLSKGFSQDYFYFVPRVGLEDVIEAMQGNNLLALSASSQSVFEHNSYKELINKFLSTVDRSSVFLQLCPVETPFYDQVNKRVLDAADDFDLKVIANSPVYYLDEQDADTRDIYHIICNRQKVGEIWNRVPHTRDHCIAQRGEIISKLKSFSKRTGLPVSKEFILNQNLFSGLIDYKWEKQEVSLPLMASDEFAELTKLCKEGWNSRLKVPTLGFLPTPLLLNTTYKNILIKELRVLQQMGFSGYFLLVQDLVKWSKEEGIRVGPGRGSVGGSLIAFLLGITDVDPVRFGLIFERFINPERLDLPDADLDFMSTRRGEIFTYLEGKYGADRVAGISNYGTLGAASALRDVGRVHNLSGLDLTVTKSITLGQTLQEAKREIPEIDKFATTYPEIWNHAERLQGVMRNYGRHAAGTIVSGRPLIDLSVVESRKEGERTVNWDKRYCEDMGLVKLDILGLSTLDVIDIALKHIEERHSKKLDLLTLPLDDKVTMDSFGKGKTTGVFQFESSGMKELLKNLASGVGRLEFDHIVAATALYRPGPMESGLLDDYVSITKGFRAISYEHENMKPALEETNGVIVYQEQVMKVAQDLAGFSMAEADHLRKAMGKKSASAMAEMRDKWVDGCLSKSGMPAENSESLFDKIEKFAGYAFNKSHSVEYTIISYWTMWLKVNYPAEFFAACLTIMSEGKRPGLVSDAQQHGIEVCPPNINKSTDRFEVDYDADRATDVLLAPFGSIKGVSINGSNAIMEAREKVGGSFTDVEQFESSVAKRLCNSRSRNALRSVGAYADIEKGLPARHPDRLKDQIELLPGLITQVIKADRAIVIDKFVKAKLLHNFTELQANSEAPEAQIPPRIGANPKVMIVFDAPTWSDEREGKMFSGKSHDELKEVMKEVGLRSRDCVFTSLMKKVKPEDGFTNDDNNFYNDYLRQELDVMKPPVIITMGNLAMRAVDPRTAKLKPGELIGKTAFEPTLDATIIFGFNPARLHFNPEMKDDLVTVMSKAVETIT